MDFNWDTFLRRNHDFITKEWVRRLNAEGGDRYAARSKVELLGTVTQASEANYQIVVNNDHTLINEFIDKITMLRLEEGFLLHDVQRAFGFYRKIIIPLLSKECDTDEFKQSVETLNECLAYSIYRFSDRFQKMHKRRLQDYADQLERDVKARTAELAESKRKYKTMIEEINDGYIIILDERIVFVNPAFCRMHGYDRKEIINRPLQDFVDPESHQIIKSIFENKQDNRPASMSSEYTRLTMDGDSFPTEITVKPTIYDNSFFYYCICRDITERIRMEQKVRETEKMAYIGQITASLSHEIRNPLSAVKMNLQILKKNVFLRGNDKRRLDISVREVNRLEGILRELLDFAKPLSLDILSVSINQILSECVDLLETKLLQKKLTLGLVLDEDIPEFQADHGKLEQTFINLLLNSIDASHNGGNIQIASQYGLSGGHPRIKITIDDNGAGIPGEYLEEIFKPFFTTKTKGTGLGLATVNRIVKAHGGIVTAANRDFGGASFRISLPTGADNG